MLVDYHIHALGHADREHSLENLKEYLKYARARGISELGFADHDRYLSKLDFKLYQELQTFYPEIKIRVGLEVDYYPGQEKRLREIANSFAFDYLIGSVHYIGEWMFDDSKQQQKFIGRDIDQLYREYLNLVAGAAQTGLFLITGHLDLLKIFGHRPQKSLRATFEPVLGVLSKSGMVIELNTNGWYKPVSELYPEPGLLALCFEKNIPITLSSDAHQADQVGRDISRASQIAKQIGYRKIAVFFKQQINFVNLS